MSDCFIIKDDEGKEIDRIPLLARDHETVKERLKELHQQFPNADEIIVQKTTVLQ